MNLKHATFTKDDIVPTLKRMMDTIVSYPITVLIFVLMPFLVSYGIKGSAVWQGSGSMTMGILLYLAMVCTTVTLFLTPVAWNAMLFTKIFGGPVSGTFKGFNATGLMRNRIILVVTLPAVMIVVVLFIAWIGNWLGGGSSDDSAPSTLAATGTVLTNMVISIIVGVYLAVNHISDTVKFPTSGLMSEDSAVYYIRGGVGDNFMFFLYHISSNALIFFISTWIPSIVTTVALVAINCYAITGWNYIFFSNIYPKVKVTENVDVDDRDLATDIS